jgi:hypothetical protein
MAMTSSSLDCPSPFAFWKFGHVAIRLPVFGALSPRLAKTQCQAAEQLPPLATKCLASLPRPPMRQISASSTQRRTMHPPRRAFLRTQTVWPKPGMLAVSHISGIGLGVLYPSCRTASGLTARSTTAYPRSSGSISARPVRNRRTAHPMRANAPYMESLPCLHVTRGSDPTRAGFSVLMESNESRVADTAADELAAEQDLKVVELSVRFGGARKDRLPELLVA